MSVKINNDEEQGRLENWSKSRSFSDVAYWCELPKCASIPALQECQKCKEEKRQRYRGHNEDWCRNNRKPKRNEEPKSDHLAETESVEGNIQIVEDEKTSNNSDLSNSSDTENENEERREASADPTTTWRQTMLLVIGNENWSYETK